MDSIISIFVSLIQLLLFSTLGLIVWLFRAIESNFLLVLELSFIPLVSLGFFWFFASSRKKSLRNLSFNHNAILFGALMDLQERHGKISAKELEKKSGDELADAEKMYLLGVYRTLVLARNLLTRTIDINDAIARDPLLRLNESCLKSIFSNSEHANELGTDVEFILERLQAKDFLAVAYGDLTRLTVRKIYDSIIEDLTDSNFEKRVDIFKGSMWKMYEDLGTPLKEKEREFTVTVALYKRGMIEIERGELPTILIPLFNSRADILDLLKRRLALSS
ncbi:MAG: hypothetical protein AAFQ29_09375 [Pseudomonadota bacterium]